MLKQKVLIYDGKSSKLLTIERKMIGSKVGEFVFTRKIGVTHKKKVLNKKKGKKK
jgi:ribosomal protein S19